MEVIQNTLVSLCREKTLDRPSDRPCKCNMDTWKQVESGKEVEVFNGQMKELRRFCVR